MLIAPSILSADLADLAGALTLCEKAPADCACRRDGRPFRAELTIGPPVLAAISKRTSLPLDVHLMITNPDEMAEAYVAAGAAAVTVHWEATRHLHRLLTAIRRRGARAGVAINPATPPELLVDILPQVDQVLLMSVNPGFSGQEFIPETLDKARRLRQILAGEGGANSRRPGRRGRAE